MNSDRLFFCSDYMEGAHPSILNKLLETNLMKTGGYGSDPYSASAKDKIRQACQCPDAEVHLLVGGTQVNRTVIDSVLGMCQGVLAADTGHIATHEAGAIENGGHKVLTLPGTLGKISATQIRQFVSDYYKDDNREHMVMPGMVYISQPTEFGTLYSLSELEAIHDVCQDYHMPLYMDGARMAYGLSCSTNDVSLADIARLCDIFYIGGTKCGALFGEAVVIPKRGLIPNFFSIVKQHGALLAKGRIVGIQFDVLFTDQLYEHIGDSAIELAQKLQSRLKEMGYQLLFESPSNQIFCVIENKEKEELAKSVEFSFWDKYDEEHTAIRFCTSWATSEEDLERLLAILEK